MKKSTYLFILFFIISLGQLSFAQSGRGKFKMEGSDAVTLEINKTYTSSVEIYPFNKNTNKIFGMAVTAKVVLESEEAVARFILIDDKFNEYLIYETYRLLEDEPDVNLEAVCEETALMEKIKPYSVRLEIKEATIELENFAVTTKLDPTINLGQLKKQKKAARETDKIKRINNKLKQKALHWRAGKTNVSEMSYSERKKLYGQSTFPPGFEYYSGGIISTNDMSLKSAAAESLYVKSWDWRNRHGQNWISPVTNQGACGSCWAFAATGATEAMTNLYFNQQLNLDLSEEDVLSCSGGGTCGGGYPYKALDYIKNTGVVDEACFPYNGLDQSCENKGSNPGEVIKISGRINFGYSEYPKDEDVLKGLLITMGPLSSGLYDWSHAIVLVGYKVVEAGDQFFYRDLNLNRYWITIQEGDPLIGKTVWIFKNSWGPAFGDEGYIYVETPITNIGWTHAIQTPVISEVNNYEVICEDRDGDGYYWWGLGEKPATCDCPDIPDGDDSDATLGPLDEYGNCTILTSTPVANFSSDKTAVIVGETITFSDLSTNNPISWKWTFAGGEPSTSTNQNPSVSYAVAGTYDVTLEVTNSNGSDSKTVLGYVTVEEGLPVADFTADKTMVSESGTVLFTDLSVNNPTSWTWTFDGGEPSISTSQNPSVSYATAGTYDVTLEVANAAGSDSKTVLGYVTVEEGLPVADFTADKTTIPENGTVSFTDLSTNTPTSWSWTFDGGEPSTSTSQNPSVSYITAGIYNVTLEVTNATGTVSKTLNAYITVEVDEQQVDPVVTYCSSSGSTEQEWIAAVNIQGDVYSSGASLNGYEDFSSNQTFSLEAGTDNTFELTAGYTNKTRDEFWQIWIDLNTDSDFNDPGELVFTSAPHTGKVSGAFSLTAVSGLTTRMRISMKRKSPAGACEVYSQGEVEDYTVQIVESVPQPPVADFTASITNILVGESVQFTDLSTNEPTSYQWYFPGGNPETSTKQNPVVSYADPGEYSVTLIVSKETFPSSTEEKVNFITVSEQTSVEYCVPTAVNSSSDYIKEVQIGNVLNTATAGAGYAMMPDEVSIYPGQSYNVSLTPFDASNRNYWKIWIDFNNDGDFNDADETLLSAKNKRGTFSSSINIPFIASGVTRMRIAMQTQGDPAPCDDNYPGEVEDYTVIFTTAASYSVQVATASTDFNVSHGMSVFPNPVSQKLNIKLESVGINDYYMLYSINGSKLKSSTINNHITPVDFSEYPAGVYYITVFTNNEIYKEKIIKR